MIGFRVLRRKRQVSAEMIDSFRTLPVANVSDVMMRMAAGGVKLVPMHKAGVTMAGPALTVKTRPGDNLMVHKALEMAEPGDVIVVDAGGDLTNALVGELMLAHAKVRRLGGVVLNGAVRDVAFIRQENLPVYAAGVTHRGPYKDGPGEINVPVAIEGMVINPGDLMIGDEDGLLCVPYEHVEDVYQAARAKSDAEKNQMSEILQGRRDRSWIDAELKRRGCSFEG
jgi:RraA family protein